MKIGLLVQKIHQFEPDTMKNMQDHCVPKTAKIEGLISPFNASSMAKMKLTEFFVLLSNSKNVCSILPNRMD